MFVGRRINEEKDKWIVKNIWYLIKEVLVIFVFTVYISE